MKPSGPPAACMRNVAKSYGPVPVLNDVNLTMEYGAVHALLGVNGAGKSTLVKILAGVLPADRGRVEVGGKRLRAKPRAARQLGVRCIHQSRMLSTNLTVADNINLAGIGFRRSRTTDRKRAGAALDSLGVVDIDVDTLVGTLPPGEAQLVEIARELADDANLVIMDEPTAALSTVEARRLLETMKRLRSLGKAVLLVSHDLADVIEVADTVTVIRDGRVVLSRPASDLDSAAIAKAMLDEDLQSSLERSLSSNPSEVRLALRAVSRGVLSGLSFEVHAGEVLGVTGILGSGLDEVAQIAAGVVAPTSGEVAGGSSDGLGAWASRSGPDRVGYVPADRARHGMFPGMSAQRQLDLTRANLARHSVLARAREERRRAEKTAAMVGLEQRYLALPGRALSGGNQQKVVLGRALQAAPRILVAHEPTSGVDVGARAAIHRRLLGLAEDGHAVLLVSSDMSEIADLASRVVVLRRGTAAYVGPPRSPTELMEMATAGLRT